LLPHRSSNLNPNKQEKFVVQTWTRGKFKQNHHVSWKYEDFINIIEIIIVNNKSRMFHNDPLTDFGKDESCAVSHLGLAHRKQIT
jgi:hypothetical protein